MAEKETKTVETKVEQVNVDLNDIFNAAPGGDSITLPEQTTEETKKPGIFSRKEKVDTSFSAIETRYGSGYRWNVS